MNYELLQVIAVIGIVGAAVSFVLRRAWRKQKGQAPACGHCNACQRKGG